MAETDTTRLATLKPIMVRFCSPSGHDRSLVEKTVRRQIRASREGPHGAKKSPCPNSGKGIEHLEHLRKSLHAEGRRLTQVPAECRGCGFVFRKRDRLKGPGRCPVCKGEAISDPSFRIEG
jgi:predicted Zn-ribbon and HTH transcriptional regulator